jgi:hypothetical protein
MGQLGSMLAVFNAGLDSFTSTSKQSAFYARLALNFHGLTHCCAVPKETE